jgi:hypothetical protein
VRFNCLREYSVYRKVAVEPARAGCALCLLTALIDPQRWAAARSPRNAQYCLGGYRMEYAAWHGVCTCISSRFGAISSMSIDLNGTPLSRNPSLYLFPLYSLRCPQPQSPQRSSAAVYC